MIPIYQLVVDPEHSLNHERILARRMGKPPFPVTKVSEDVLVGDLLNSMESERVVMIFDPEFWYSQECWISWLAAETSEPTDAMISLPVGNQNPEWRKHLNIPHYLTIQGLEKASSFKSEMDWMVRQVESQMECCVFVLPRVVMSKVPEQMKLKEIPGYFSRKKIKARVFCHGWLHSFNAIIKAGCRQDLIAMTDWHGKILEMGCGIGLMAKTFKEMGHKVTWIGLDLDPEVISQARRHVDLAIVADARDHLPLNPAVKFDRVVCGDFLEHLPFPWVFLTRLREIMAVNGQLIASVPNVGHWSVVEDLLAGRFDEAPAGIMCVTHLRFGTKTSWGRWLEQSGWGVIRWEEERLPLPNHLQTFGDDFGLKTDRDSLETIRYRLLAEVR